MATAQMFPVFADRGNSFPTADLVSQLRMSYSCLETVSEGNVPLFKKPGQVNRGRLTDLSSQKTSGGKFSRKVSFSSTSSTESLTMTDAGEMEKKKRNARKQEISVIVEDILNADLDQFSRIPDIIQEDSDADKDKCFENWVFPRMKQDSELDVLDQAMEKAIRKRLGFREVTNQRINLEEVSDFYELVFEPEMSVM